jgi:c-di-GMP-binding flagellar brake protein YcgR
MDFMRFVETAGLDVRLHNCPDIVQLALQEPHDSDVYLAALRLVQSRPQKTYLRFQCVRQS